MPKNTGFNINVYFCLFYTKRDFSPFPLTLFTFMVSSQNSTKRQNSGVS